MRKICLVLISALLAVGCVQETHRPSPEERETYLLHEGLNRVAQLSLKVLRATDTDDLDARALRAEARAHLIVYSREVADLSEQYNWPLLEDSLVAEVNQYLKETEGTEQSPGGDSLKAAPQVHVREQKEIARHYGWA